MTSSLWPPKRSEVSLVAFILYNLSESIIVVPLAVSIFKKRLSCDHFHFRSRVNCISRPWFGTSATKPKRTVRWRDFRASRLGAGLRNCLLLCWRTRCQIPYSAHLPCRDRNILICGYFEYAKGFVACFKLIPIRLAPSWCVDWCGPEWVPPGINLPAYLLSY